METPPSLLTMKGCCGTGPLQGIKLFHVPGDSVRRMELVLLVLLLPNMHMLVMMVLVPLVRTAQHCMIAGNEA